MHNRNRGFLKSPYRSITRGYNHDKKVQFSFPNPNFFELQKYVPLCYALNLLQRVFIFFKHFACLTESVGGR